MAVYIPNSKFKSIGNKIGKQAWAVHIHAQEIPHLDACLGTCYGGVSSTPYALWFDMTQHLPGALCLQETFFISVSSDVHHHQQNTRFSCHEQIKHLIHLLLHFLFPSVTLSIPNVKPSSPPRPSSHKSFQPQLRIHHNLHIRPRLCK